MRTVCGLARSVQRLIGRTRANATPRPVAAVRPLAGGRRPLIADRLGEQRRGGARLDQVDGTTCGSAVLVALAAWADPAETLRLDGELGTDVANATGASAAASTGITQGFGARFDARQQQVHRESTRFWPQALGTSPWGMVSWLRRNAPGAGPYRVRLVDDTSRADIAGVVVQVEAALAAGRPVPLLIGTFVPRHYVLAIGVGAVGVGATGVGAVGVGAAAAGAGGWRVYEPSSGQVRTVETEQVERRKLAPVLGFDRLHAVLLPS